MSQNLYPQFGILLVDDESAWLRCLNVNLEISGSITNTILCEDSRLVMEILSQNDIGLVLLDLTMPHLSGDKLLEMICEQHPEITVIVVSGMNQVHTAVHCMRLGAFDYFVKTEEERLLSGIMRAVRMIELERENREMRSRFLSDTLEHPEAFAAMITNCKAMRSIFQYVESVAGSKQPVLITGESGVGKELIARSLHTLSTLNKWQGPLIAVNVAGLDDTVFSDTLFGHTKGAFTGAAEARSGMIEQAAKGTLFLDEIGELSPGCQVKLLRLVQEGEFYPVGSDRPKRLNARIIAATNQDLAAKRASGKFRKDLYYRLCTHHIHLPPLRERREDIPLLLDYFLQEAAEALGKKKPTYPKELPVLLSTHSFPGNVRELKSMVYDAVSRHTSRVLSMHSFVSAIGGEKLSRMRTEDELVDAGKAFVGLERLPTLEEAAEMLIEEAVRRASGNQTIAARMLGISQPALCKRLKHSS
jgi:DNA-binding NtrC family response regulator